ncbi:hypothetical protein CoNPh35_CDS0037 [Staphylococcus phage S-CoN_Ph35]|nr:hypothetical protein CoNPh35_CDS0037 [Staphylococcus phage S-CoN_Ph35]
MQLKALGFTCLFAAYEKNEGYNGSWGWLNHTSPQGNYLTDAQFVARKLVSQSRQAGTTELDRCKEIQLTLFLLV